MKPKKSLGQNFLKDRSILEKTIKAADIKADDLVIEIGPGTGILTKKLIKHSKKVIAIEKDDNLANQLDFYFRGNDRIEIIHGDILKINLPELIEQKEFFNYKVIANIPYYITSPIIQLFLETKYLPKEMILMVQKEVAQRICEKPGNMSILAVSVQYYTRPELLFYVPKTVFWPIPEVDSAVIKISNLKPQTSKIESRNFFRIVKAGFCSKRKTLLNNLSNSFHLDKKIAEEKIKKAGIDPELRAQELSVADWKKLEIEFS